MNRSGDVALRYMRDLVGKYTRYLVFIAARFDQAGMYAYVATW